MDIIYRHMAKVLSALILVSGVTVVIFAYDLQRTLRTVHLKSESIVFGKIEDNLKDTQSIEAKEHYEVIAKRNLFEFPEGTEVKGGDKGSKAEKAVESTLNAKLTGTIVSPNGFVMALIEDGARRKEDLYMVGDSIQDGEIVEILKDRVIIQRAGRQETLALFTEKGSKGGRRSSSKEDSGGRPVGESPATGESAPVSASSEQREAQQRVRGLMAELRLRPHFFEGKPAGFIVGQSRPGSLFEEAGLEAGDIIVAINDEEVLTPIQLLRAYKVVSEDEMIWMDVSRDGEQDTIEIDLDEVLFEEVPE